MAAQQPTNARHFCYMALNGEIPMDSHKQLFRLSYIMLSYEFNLGVFGAVDAFHKRGMTFGQGDLKFNRTLDIFYLALVDNFVCHCDPDEYPDTAYSAEDYDAVADLLSERFHLDIWRQYYSPVLLEQPVTAHFYRLPDLRDLPDSDGPVGAPRNKGIGHFTKLPHWARNVHRTLRRQPTLSIDSIIDIAVNTLRETILRQRKHSPTVQPFSETQVRFWLKHMGVESFEPSYITDAYDVAWWPNECGHYIAQGGLDIWAWEAHYSPERWSAISEVRLEPDLDGTRPSEIMWSGLPDGGAGLYGCIRGWEPEVGSEEEVAFLAALAVAESEGVDMDNLNYTIRSHILLSVMQAAFWADNHEYTTTLKQRMVEAGRIDEDKVDNWVQQALLVIKPYMMEQMEWPVGQDRNELLRRILVENGQLFARWGWAFGTRHTVKASIFDLGPSRPVKIA